MKIPGLLFIIAISGVALLVVSPIPAQTPPTTPIQAAAEPGNYCAGCHTTADTRPANMPNWNGGPMAGREGVDPCPAANKIREEIYYTERLLLALDRARAPLPGWVDASQVDARIAAGRQGYSRLLDMLTSSLTAFTAEAQTLRFRLGKTYTQLNELNNSVKRDYVLAVAGLVTLFLLGSLVWGLRRTASSASGSRFHLSFKTLFFAAGVFILFALPIFQVWSREVGTVSAEEQARQTALDTISRTADAANQALARAWLLGRVGAVWVKSNSAQAETALTTALAAAEEKERNNAALWGESQAAYEGAVGSLAAQQKAGLVAGRLDAVNSRAWALRLIAAEWAAIDPARAEKTLAEAVQVAEKGSALYRDLDLRAIAVTWAMLDRNQGLTIAKRVSDPALRAWGLWEMAEVSGDAALYEQAVEIARQVADPLTRARLLREIAVHSGNKTLFDEARSALAEVQGASLAYALSDLVAASGQADLVDQIAPAYPDARAAALVGLGQFEPAWAETLKIADPFDRAQAQATIAGAWANAEAARQIADPTLRDLALRDVAIAKDDITLAQTIESPYYKVQALTTLGQYQAAWAEAGALKDTYPLRLLGVAWAETDPQAALAVVDKLDREADKAAVLREIARVTGDEGHFERALGMALAARVRGDVLAATEASLALGAAFETIDPAKAEATFNQAYEAAQQISIK